MELRVLRMIGRCYALARPATGGSKQGREARMSIEELINSIQVFDIIVVIGLLGMFILGYVQGVVRRLIGIVSVCFAFIVAAQARDPLGNWLASNWIQFPADYSRMIAFGFVFGLIGVGLAILTEFNYKTLMLWPKWPVVEEVVGGLLGVVQGLIIILALVIIIDPYFRGAGSDPAPNELPLLRNIHDAFDESRTATLYRSTLVPGTLAMFGALIPDTIEAGLRSPG
jgi:uncharacterized membrane protein required for colicin V production